MLLQHQQSATSPLSHTPLIAVTTRALIGLLTTRTTTSCPIWMTGVSRCRHLLRLRRHRCHQMLLPLPLSQLPLHHRHRLPQVRMPTSRQHRSSAFHTGSVQAPVRGKMRLRLGAVDSSLQENYSPPAPTGVVERKESGNPARKSITWDKRTAMEPVALHHGNCSQILQSHPLRVNRLLDPIEMATRDCASRDWQRLMLRRSQRHLMPTLAQKVQSASC